MYNDLFLSVYCLLIYVWHNTRCFFSLPLIPLNSIRLVPSGETFHALDLLFFLVRYIILPSFRKICPLFITSFSNPFSNQTFIIKLVQTIRFFTTLFPTSLIVYCRVCPRTSGTISLHSLTVVIQHASSVHDSKYTIHIVMLVREYSLFDLPFPSLPL